MWRLLPAVLLALPLTAADREFVVIDTDCGAFGDDGAALAMLLRTPRISVPAITSVAGNVWAPQAAEYVMHILDLLRRPDIPVLIGADVPLMNSSALAKEEERRWGKLDYTGAF